MTVIFLVTCILGTAVVHSPVAPEKSGGSVDRAACGPPGWWPPSGRLLLAPAPIALPCEDRSLCGGGGHAWYTARAMGAG